jgi:hypothetical protein
MQMGLLLISVLMASMAGRPVQTFDKSGYYAVLAAGKITGIDSELTVLSAAAPKEKEAYEGALLMRKAGLLGRAREKLRVFRSGAVKLESALAADSGNGEYHFLRLIIQEHAPGILHYNKDMEKDSQQIYRSYRNLSPAVRKAIIDYSKRSKHLRAKELNG